VEIERVAPSAGDYAVAYGEATAAAVERKTLENFTASLSDGTLAFQIQHLSEVGAAAVVVEGRYSALFSREHVPAAFIADGLARLQVRYPRNPGRLRRIEEVRRGMDLSIPRRGPR
jgi:ERCC4-type nuclease